jgi:hypothetical protein
MRQCANAKERIGMHLEEMTTYNRLPGESLFQVISVRALSFLVAECENVRFKCDNVVFKTPLQKRHF